MGMRLGRVGTSLSHMKTFEQGQFQGSSLSLSKVTKLTLQQGQGKVSLSYSLTTY